MQDAVEERQRMSMAQLVEQDTGQPFPLGREPVSIGRHDDNTVVLVDSRVSRHHAEVVWQGGRWLVCDLGSANGTLVNGQRITAPRALEDGDTIQVGQTRLRVQVAEALAARDTLVERIRPQAVLRPRPRNAWLMTALGLVAAAAVLAVVVGVLSIWPGIRGDGDEAQATAVPPSPTIGIVASAPPPTLPATEPPPAAKPTATAIPTIPPPSPPPTRVAPTAAPPPPTETTPSPPTIGYFRADGTTIETGQCARLQWGQVRNASSVTLSGVGRVKAAGKLDVCLDASKSYTLQATGPGGTVEESVQITVQPPTGSVIEYFRVVPSIISPGDCAQLEWGKVEFATSATIEPGLGGVGTPDSREVCPGSTTTYVLTAEHPEGRATAQTTLLVSSEPAQKPVIAFFTANPVSIAAGECTTLSWGKVDYATSVTIDHGIGGVATPGSKEVCPGATTTYAMRAEGPSGTTDFDLTVSVSAGQLAELPDLVVESIVFAPNPCFQGQKCRVRVKVRNDGPVLAGRFVVRWVPAGATEVPVEWDLDGLDAGQEMELTYTWLPVRPDENWQTVATVDVYDAVAEIEEGTANTLEQFIHVVARE
jgi:hypothetical protein